MENKNHFHYILISSCHNDDLKPGTINAPISLCDINTLFQAYFHTHVKTRANFEKVNKIKNILTP